MSGLSRWEHAVIEWEGWRHAGKLKWCRFMEYQSGKGVSSEVANKFPKKNLKFQSTPTVPLHASSLHPAHAPSQPDVPLINK